MKKGLVIIGFIFLVLVAGYFILGPIFYNFLWFLRPRLIPDISYARNYYSVISSSFGVLIGILGLTLGCFYYNNRKTIDILRMQREQKRKRLEAFMEEIDKYDEYIRKVLSITVMDETELEWIRTCIDRSFEIIEGMLEQGFDLLALDENEARIILKVNSFVNKCEIIMHTPFKDLTKERNYLIRDRYADLIHAARQICYQKIL